MPIITLNFTFPVQTSVQINDIAYYVEVWEKGGFDMKNKDLVKIGKILSVGINSITCEISSSTVPPVAYQPGTPPYHLIMFSKDNEANMSSLLGYYADVKLINDSTEKGEIFSIGSEYFESSK